MADWEKIFITYITNKHCKHRTPINRQFDRKIKNTHRQFTGERAETLKELWNLSYAKL